MNEPKKDPQIGDVAERRVIRGRKMKKVWMRFGDPDPDFLKQLAASMSNGRLSSEERAAVKASDEKAKAGGWYWVNDNDEVTS